MFTKVKLLDYKTDDYTDFINAKNDEESRKIDQIILEIRKLFEDYLKQSKNQDMAQLVKALIMYINESNKRMEELRSDFNKRFETFDKRMEELRSDFNKQMEELRSDFNKQMEELRSDFNKQYETFNKRMESFEKRMDSFEKQLKLFDKKFDLKLTAMGARWGIDSEEAFRNGVAMLLKEFADVSVSKWEATDEKGIVFGDKSRIELDVVVHDSIHVLIEIKSSVSKGDILVLLRKAEVYREKVKPEKIQLMIISPYIDERAIEFAKSKNIRISKILNQPEQAANEF